ncbi:MAG: hypothetical protein ACOC0E_03505 [Spirochaetota bacterium]
MTFYSETGRIVSDVINYSAHLEKAATRPGHVSLSQRAVASCDPRILTIFRDCGEFEGFPYMTTADRLDTLFADPSGCSDVSDDDGSAVDRREASG